MVKVAVAGGTSPVLGRSIVQGLLATDGKHEVVILSRAAGTKHGARVAAADYCDPDALAALLKREAVHTLISVLRLDDLAAMVEVHRALLNAALATGVSRFILSDWSLGPLSAKTVEILAHKDELHEMGRAAMADAEAGDGHVVECCTIQNRMFMEYFIEGSEGCWFDDPFMLDYIDVKNGILMDPRQDDLTPSKTSTTSLKDIARFVAAAMDLGPGQLVGRIGLSGQVLPNYQYVADILKSKCGKEIVLHKVTPKDCDKLAEESGAEFQQAMQKGDFDLKSFMVRATAQMIRVNCEGKMGGAMVEPNLNELCSHIKPVQIEDLLVEAWGTAA